MNRLATAGAGGPQLYCYLSVAVKRNNTENSLIQSLGSLQTRPFSFFRFDLRYGEGAGRSARVQATRGRRRPRTWPTTRKARLPELRRAIDDRAMPVARRGAASTRPRCPAGRV